MTTAKEMKDLADKSSVGIVERQLPKVLVGLQDCMKLMAKLGSYHMIWEPPTETHEKTMCEVVKWMDDRGFHWKQFPDLAYKIWWS